MAINCTNNSLIPAAPVNIWAAVQVYTKLSFREDMMTSRQLIPGLQKRNSHSALWPVLEFQIASLTCFFQPWEEV